MTNFPDLLCRPLDARDENAQGGAPVQVFTHDEQIAEYVRLVEEARMRT